MPHARETAALGSLPEACASLLRYHHSKVPLPDQGLSLLSGWAERVPLPEDPTSLLHLYYLAATSEALFLSLLRRPQSLQLLTKEICAGIPIGPPGMEESLARFLLQRWDAPLESKLSAFRAHQSARIIIQETLGILPMQEATRELSHLADTIIGRAFTATFGRLQDEMGTPLKPVGVEKSAPCSLAVFALGKLGGLELNYASDVDLIFFYEHDGTTDGGADNALFFNGWVRDAISLLSRPTPDGPCLKVDANLRPRGRDGELTLSFGSALAYYRDWADLWERQAWLKARPCAGDRSAGAAFLNKLEPEIYRPYAPEGIASMLREQREKTLAQVAARSPAEADRDIKEGRGGIRDIEFSVQALQMAKGPTDRWVREPNTLLAITKLGQKKYLQETECSSLSQAYTLLRKAEHWAQVQQMRQTHLLPLPGSGYCGLARHLGLSSEEEARRQVGESRRVAEENFTLAVSRLSAGLLATDDARALFQADGLFRRMDIPGLADPDRVRALLSGIYASFSDHLAEPRRQRNFLMLHYSLARELATSTEPHRGLIKLRNLLPTLRADADTIPYLLDHPRLAKLLFRVIQSSDRLFEMIQQWPSLIKSLAYDRLRETRSHIERIGSSSGIDELRRAHKEALFLIAARSLLIEDEVGWAQERLTALAEAVLGRVLLWEVVEICPESGVSADALLDDIAIIGLGRLGQREMLFGSDLDLVILKRGPWLLQNDPERSAAIESSLLRGLIRAMTGVTRYGSLYPVDLRLRPYGSSGPPLASIDSLTSYFEGPAELWERISYLKARTVAGNLELGEQIIGALKPRILAKAPSQHEMHRLTALRDRLFKQNRDIEGAIKFSPGGLLTLDLFIACLRISLASADMASSFSDFLKELLDRGKMEMRDCERLMQARWFQEELLFRVRMCYPKPPDLKRVGDAMGRIWTSRRGQSTMPLKAAVKKAGHPTGEIAKGREAAIKAWQDSRAFIGGLWDGLVAGSESGDDNRDNIGRSER